MSRFSPRTFIRGRHHIPDRPPELPAGYTTSGKFLRNPEGAWIATIEFTGDSDRGLCIESEVYCEEDIRAVAAFAQRNIK